MIKCCDKGNYDSLELIWEREQGVDWSKVAVDEKILVRMSVGRWSKRHFAKFENGKIFTFGDGKTSFTSNKNLPLIDWDEAKIYKGDE